MRTLALPPLPVDDAPRSEVRSFDDQRAGEKRPWNPRWSKSVLTAEEQVEEDAEDEERRRTLVSRAFDPHWRYPSGEAYAARQEAIVKMMEER